MDPKNFNYVLLIAIIAGFGITIGLQGYQLINTTAGGASGQQSVTLDIEGSTTCEPIISAAAIEYMSINRDWNIYISGTGSGDGIAAIESGNADIGMASRNLKESENATGDLIDHRFAFDGIAVVVGSGVSLTDDFINFSTIVNIYNQTYTDWSEVPGCTTSGSINCYVRGSESGTRATFESITGLATADNWPAAASSHSEVASNGDMQSNIQTDTNGIGYVGLGFMSGVNELKISENTPGNAYYPTTTTVSEGDYPISRSLHLFTSGEATGATKAFLDFIYSPKGQAIVAEQDFVSIYNGSLFM
ncbi:MAG: phosphate ABC transporter substrate-binding protein [Promethearchaeota archaeon]|nr:MAG: phosphate ABC transporter substrate-binding protein [Candidatus Lokiarchaeota archaeon]